ncbi:MAG: hypothetical protein GX573_12295 [Chloroflexi bacterium]|nr:hypothetical protein [Chloroflexota bacterium]
MTPLKCLAMIGAILLASLLCWVLDRWLYPPVPDELVTRRRRSTPWYR